MKLIEKSKKKRKRPLAYLILKQFKKYSKHTLFFLLFYFYLKIPEQIDILHKQMNSLIKK